MRVTIHFEFRTKDIFRGENWLNAPLCKRVQTTTEWTSSVPFRLYSSLELLREDTNTTRFEKKHPVKSPR